MNYVVMPFTCEECRARLEADVQAVPGFGGGGHTATCPKCGKTQGNFPASVIRVVEVPKDS